MKDGFLVLRTIFRNYKNYKPLKWFSFIALIFLIFGLLVGITVINEFARTNYITKVPSAILATGLMIFAIIIEQCGIILDNIERKNKEAYELNLLRYKQMEDYLKK